MPVKNPTIKIIQAAEPTKKCEFPLQKDFKEYFPEIKSNLGKENSRFEILLKRLIEISPVAAICLFNFVIKFDPILTNGALKKELSSLKESLNKNQILNPLSKRESDLIQQITQKLDFHSSKFEFAVKFK